MSSQDVHACHLVRWIEGWSSSHPATFPAARHRPLARVRVSRDLAAMAGDATAVAADATTAVAWDDDVGSGRDKSNAHPSTSATGSPPQLSLDCQLKPSQYRLGKFLGRGTSATVYAAKHTKTRKPAVIKKLDRVNATAEMALLREVDLMKTICCHPNIVHFHGWFREPKTNTLCLVLGRCHGGDLDTYLKRTAEAGTVLAERQTMLWMVQLLFALTFIHGTHVVHRDLKPANILLSRSHRIVRLADLGVAKHLDQDGLAHTVVGTPYYMAPETVSGRPYTFAADVWSLGCVAYELATVGKRAFDARSLPQLVVRVVRNNYAPLPSYVSRPYARLVDSMLRSAPEDRPSAADLMAQRYVMAFAEELAGDTLESTTSTASTMSSGALTSRRGQETVTQDPSNISLQYATTMSSTIKSKARRKKRRSEALQLAEQMRRRELESALKCRDNRTEARAKAWEYEMRTSRRAVRERREQQELMKAKKEKQEQQEDQEQTAGQEEGDGEDARARQRGEQADGTKPPPSPPLSEEHESDAEIVEEDICVDDDVVVDDDDDYLDDDHGLRDLLDAATKAEEATARLALPLTRPPCDDTALDNGSGPTDGITSSSRLVQTLPSNQSSLLEMERAFAQLSRSDLFPREALGRPSDGATKSVAAWSGDIDDVDTAKISEARLPGPAFAGVQARDAVIPLRPEDTVDEKNVPPAIRNEQDMQATPIDGTISALDETRLEALLADIWSSDPNARWAMLERIWLQSLEEQRERQPLSSLSPEESFLNQVTSPSPDTSHHPGATEAVPQEMECMSRALRKHISHSPQPSRGASLDRAGAQAMKAAAAELRVGGIDLPTSTTATASSNATERDRKAAANRDGNLDDTGTCANDSDDDIDNVLSDASSDALEVESEDVFFSSDSDWEEEDFVPYKEEQ